MEQNVTALIEALTERQQALECQLNGLSTTVAALEARIAAFALPAPSSAAPAPASAAPVAPVSPAKGKITPEILVILAATATAFLGKEVRIRSAQIMHSPYEIVNTWAQQGRAFIQASHNPHFRH